MSQDFGLPWQGKYAGMVVCWLLGNGCLFSWNSMLTIEDYYTYLFPVAFMFQLHNFCKFCFSRIWSSIKNDLNCNLQDYHPSRVLTLVYQPFALITLAILAYHEAKVNTRLRNLFGYTLFFLSSLLIIVVSSVSDRQRKHSFFFSS